MPDPIQTGSEAVAPRGPMILLHTSLLLYQIRFAKTWPSQPELNWIRAGFAQYDQCHLWKNATQAWKWETGR